MRFIVWWPEDPSTRFLRSAVSFFFDAKEKEGEEEDDDEAITGEGSGELDRSDEV